NGSLRIHETPGEWSRSRTAATAAGIAPRCTGMCSACITISPRALNSAVEASRRSLMLAECAAPTSTAPISSHAACSAPAVGRCSPHRRAHRHELDLSILLAVAVALLVRRGKRLAQLLRVGLGRVDGQLEGLAEIAQLVTHAHTPGRLAQCGRSARNELVAL